jgi:hypothetical protein
MHIKYLTALLMAVFMITGISAGTERFPDQRSCQLPDEFIFRAMTLLTLTVGYSKTGVRG